MALPPEPLSELIPRSSLIVVAVVVAVLSTGTKPPAPANAEPGMTSTGQKSPAQKVRLKVERTLRGKASAQEIEVEKPVAPYLLEAGNKGAFFIDEKNEIIGRYGPDTHSVEAVQRALAAGN